MDSDHMIDNNNECLERELLHTQNSQNYKEPVLAPVRSLYQYDFSKEH